MSNAIAATASRARQSRHASATCPRAPSQPRGRSSKPDPRADLDRRRRTPRSAKARAANRRSAGGAPVTRGSTAPRLPIIKAKGQQRPTAGARPGLRQRAAAEHAEAKNAPADVAGVLRPDVVVPGVAPDVLARGQHVQHLVQRQPSTLRTSRGGLAARIADRQQADRAEQRRTGMSHRPARTSFRTCSAFDRAQSVSNAKQQQQIGNGIDSALRQRQREQPATAAA